MITQMSLAQPGLSISADEVLHELDSIDRLFPFKNKIYYVENNGQTAYSFIGSEQFTHRIQHLRCQEVISTPICDKDEISEEEQVISPSSKAAEPSASEVERVLRGRAIGKKRKR